MFGLPFQKSSKVIVVAPTEFSGLNAVEVQQAMDLQSLIEEHRVGIERELGCRFEFSDDSRVSGPKWVIGPWHCNPTLRGLKPEAAVGPEITLDRQSGLLTLDGRTPDEVMETLSYLRSLGRFAGGTFAIKDCTTLDDAIKRVYDEVGCSYPSFSLRRLDWQAISARHRAVIQKANDPIPEFQKWLAELQDGHTWVRPVSGYGQFPYDLILENQVFKFYRITKDSLAWKLGVRPGFELVTDEVANWYLRTGATAHSKKFTVGFRFLATEIGKKRKFTAQSPEGKLLEWEEEPTQDRWRPHFFRKKLDSGNGYMKINLFKLGSNIEQEVDAAFVEFKDSKKLIVDLRGNPGGNILLAHRIRNRFLRKDGVVGWIQSTLPDGQLSDREPIHAVIDPAAMRWLKPVVFLTDPLTFSASEDVLLGLQGQSNIKVIGQPSGGGSGRVRIVRLLNGFRLTISTALTYDLAGNCIEGRGIQLDESYPISFDEESLIEIADRSIF